MPNADDIRWFKETFRDQVEAALRGSPFTLDMIAALACQETGEIWPHLRTTGLPVERVLELCVGDTLDQDKGRRAFPRNKTDLLSKANGQAVFDVARQALTDMAQFISGYRGAATNPNKFCHGFGIFQYDLQFVLKEPEYFLEKRYARFEESLGKCLSELRNAAKRIGLDSGSALTDLQMAALAIAYNTGGFVPSKGLKQGHFDGTKFYGEQFFDFLRLSKTVALPDVEAPLPSPEPGTSAMARPTPVSATGEFFLVDVKETALRLRSTPEIDEDNPNANVLTSLPAGHPVRAVNDKKVNGFREVETNILGAHFHGFASAKFLKPAPGAAEVPVPTPAPEPPADGIVAVFMPRKSGSASRRTEQAGPHSLNEPRQPGRAATDPDGLRDELAAIVEWLAVDDPSHLRYQPRSRTTFCNIYAHDYCFLAGVYLPRVWWTQGAIESLARGKTVEPLYGDTIDEQRANDLFRWLRDFGLRFGWRRTGTLTKLQTEVNQGAVGLIVARRKEDGLSGHIVAVVPETGDKRARRNSDGDVIAPLQSQAGSTNFQSGTGKTDWWRGDQFADSAFWLHA